MLHEHDEKQDALRPDKQKEYEKREVDGMMSQKNQMKGLRRMECDVKNA